MRARELWAEEGEVSSKYFFQKESSHAVRNLITGIKDTQGHIAQTVKQMLHVWMVFYTTLFTAAYLDAAEQSFFYNKIVLTLSDTDAALCEGEVTLQECTRALNSFSNNKSPGVDGLTYKIYKTFWDCMGPDLVSVLNDSFKQGKLSLSQRTGIISLLYKKRG